MKTKLKAHSNKSADKNPNNQSQTCEFVAKEIVKKNFELVYKNKAQNSGSDLQ